MQSLVWQVLNRSAESLLILNVFHGLLAGLTLVVLLHQRLNRPWNPRADRFGAAGFALLVSSFGLMGMRFARVFFSPDAHPFLGVERVSHGILVAGVLALCAGYVTGGERPTRGWVAPAFLGLAALVWLDMLRPVAAISGTLRTHSAATLASDALALMAIALAIRSVTRGDCSWSGSAVRLIALCALAAVFLLHAVPFTINKPAGIVIWNLQEHLLSVALFAFTWAVGERSEHLLDRVFVRLNVMFIILASLILLTTAGMQKFQYFRLAEQRSTEAAEFVRGHVMYYAGQGEDLKKIFDRPEVQRRVVTEFGVMPELRQVNVYFGGEHASFRYGSNYRVNESIGNERAPLPQEPDNSFAIIRLPITGDGADARVEFIGTLDYVNAYIGKYMILIYVTFTLMVGMGTIVIGMIVADTDRQLKRQYHDLEQAQEQLAQAAKLAAIGELAGGVAHEINNPITGILALASHMAEGNSAGALTARGRRNLQLIVRQAERVAELVRGLLTFSRQTQLHKEQVDVGRLLSTAVDLVHYRFKDGSIRVSKHVAPDLPPVEGDASRLTEVFVNLLSNAIDAMPSGGTLTISLGRGRDAGVDIAVSDTGQGISQDNLPRIFDPFFTTKPPGRGTGLGLSITHGIVKDHGGEIRAQSEPGLGTTVTVWLPGQITGVKYEAACVGD